MAPVTPGQAAVPPVPTPIRRDRMRHEKCSASFSIIHSVHNRRVSPSGSSAAGGEGHGGWLQHPEFESGLLTHPLGSPRGGPDELDAHVVDPGDGADCGLDLPRQAGCEGASRGREGHLDIDDAALLDDQLVDQAEFNEIHRDLRIPNGLQRLQYRTHQSRVVFAPLRALDIRLGSGWVRIEVERISVHLFYSVFTVAPGLFSAASSACHDNVAHLTRAGYAFTPVNGSSRSISSANGSGRSGPGSPPVARAWNCANRARASATVLPFSTSVISDAAAVEIAQPRP